MGPLDNVITYQCEISLNKARECTTVGNLKAQMGSVSSCIVPMSLGTSIYGGWVGVGKEVHS